MPTLTADVPAKNHKMNRLPLRRKNKFRLLCPFITNAEITALVLKGVIQKIDPENIKIKMSGH